MKNLLLLLLFTIHCSLFTVKAQQGEWTWMNGDSTNSLGHYGNLGVFDAINSPPSLYEACEWTDFNGNFWLFGGGGPTSVYSDLWEFKPSTNQWAWIKGPGIPNQNGNYGNKGVPSPSNNPGSRTQGMATWTDLSGSLWMMGGRGDAINNEYGFLNDLWKFDIANNEWTWMGGTDTIDDLGNYGLLQVPSITNNPPSRAETNATWVDQTGNLWYFGGLGSTSGSYSDLWKYDVSINEWIWMNGSNTVNQVPIYGIKGIPDSANTPGGRWACFAKWKDHRGDFWLFGGEGFYGLSNDLWKYNSTTNKWTWMSGTNMADDTGTAGSQCLGDTMNIPSGRRENRACWTRPCDNFVNFGGLNGTNNDLWNYSVSNNQWTFLAGFNNPNYGTKLVSSPINSPPSRGGSLGWTDNLGNLWMFGGKNSPYTIFYNDMWKFIPDSTCPYISCSNLGMIDPKLTSSSITLYPNPNNGTFTLHSQLGINNYELQIVDVYGRTVYSQALTTTKEHETITLPLSSGIYFWQLLSKDNSLAKGKLVLMQ